MSCIEPVVNIGIDDDQTVKIHQDIENCIAGEGNESFDFTKNDPENSFTAVDENTAECCGPTYDIEIKFISDIPDFEYPIAKPFSILIQKDPSFVSIQSEDFKIYVTEWEYDEAIEMFYDLFVDDFYNWIEANDKNLTEDALELKRKYLEYVKIQ